MFTDGGTNGNNKKSKFGEAPDVEQEPTGDEHFSIDDLLNFDPANDPDNLLGNRWLGRGQTFILAGDSGKGKSSLLMKLVVGWALNKSPLGIQQTRPLKTLIIQDENNFGDMAEMLQGVLGTLDESQVAIVKARISIFRQSSKTGLEFANYLRKKIEAIKPDVVICDPFVSYFEGELNSSSDSKQFLRSWLGPILKDSGVLFGFLHHVRKPEKRGTGQNGEKTDADLTLSYHDITGSGEVVREPKLFFYKNDEGVEVVSIHPKKVVTVTEKEDSEKSAVLDYLKRKASEDRFVTEKELRDHAEDTTDSSFPPRKRVKDIADLLVDGVSVFRAQKMHIREGVKSSDVYSFGKPATYFFADIARRKGLPAYKPEVTDKGPDPFQ
jgi:hypothetical protein